ncbi:hypothetical protein FDECE_15326 [Fusarium decemcellulare]|nr:hypothetical protein FDECE_15326 [Fusarium decemcellulare]
MEGEATALIGRCSAIDPRTIPVLPSHANFNFAGRLLDSEYSPCGSGMLGASLAAIDTYNRPSATNEPPSPDGDGLAGRPFQNTIDLDPVSDNGSTTEDELPYTTSWDDGKTMVDKLI